MWATRESATCCPEARVSGRLASSVGASRVVFAAANEDGGTAPFFQHRTDRASLDLGAERIGDGVHRQAEASRLHPIHGNGVILGTLVESGVDVLGAVEN